MAEAGENLVGLIFERATAAGRGAQIALREGERALSYDELADQVSRSAGALKGLGVEVGDRIAVFMPDCLEAAIAILGAIHVGAIAVPVSELSAVTELRDRLNDASVCVALVHTSTYVSLDEIRGEVPGLKKIVCVGESEGVALEFQALIDESEPVAPEAISADAPAMLLYSAGASTLGDRGAPRGVAHSQATPLRAFESFAEGFLQLSSEDRVFSTVRLATAYGLGTGLIFPLLAGCESLLFPQQTRSSQVLEAIESFAPTVFVGTPSVYQQLARDAESHGSAPVLANARWCVAGAEAMPSKIVGMARDVLGATIAVGYGLTEAFQFVIAGPATDGRSGGCGSVMAGFDVRIVDDEGKEVGIDEIGTLQLRGENVAKSYWNGESVEDEWFTTLDRFMIDSAGQYYHCGRSDHLFKVGGKWVMPSEVEHALLANEAVWECAVIGADDEDGLIKPFAFVVPNLGQTPGDELEADLRAYVKNELAPYKYPRWIEFVEELPKGPTGVVLRYKLRDRLRQSRPRRRAETRGDSNR